MGNIGMRHKRSQKNAKALRKRMSNAEQHLWSHLRRRQLKGYKFRRQYPIGRYIADFACIKASLVIEVDGGQHNERTSQDTVRTRTLHAYGFRVLRFWNDAVLTETDAVLEVIAEALSPHPSPPPQAGEGVCRIDSRSLPPLVGEGQDEGMRSTKHHRSVGLK